MILLVSSVEMVHNYGLKVFLPVVLMLSCALFQSYTCAYTAFDTSEFSSVHFCLLKIITRL